MRRAKLRLDGEYLNVRDVVAILNVAPRTVAKMFDAGYLSGYRVALSGRRADRKVSRASVISYLKERRLPVPAPLVDNVVALVGCPAKFVTQVTQLAPVTGDVVVACASLFQLGRLCAENSPALRAIVVDTSVVGGLHAVLDVLRDLRDGDKPPGAVVVLLQEDEGCNAPLFAEFGALVVFASLAHGETVRSWVTKLLGHDERGAA